MALFGWFSCDAETGEVVAKTDVQNDGTVNRYEYTEPDNVHAGHGDKWYDTMDDFLKDNPTDSRDKNDPESINRPWYGNGYDLGLSELQESIKCLSIKKY